MVDCSEQRSFVLLLFRPRNNVIIVGTYPDLIGPAKTGSRLLQLRRSLDRLLPSGIIVHLLPPYPTSGDNGFAADDWFSTREELGCWRDLIEWASSRKLILDGIYNHVGSGHPWVTEFFASPKERGPIYAYRRSRPPSRQTSPRGGSVFRKYTIRGNAWYVWQTFSKSSFDIRLSLPKVQAEIGRHLNFLVDSGIYGVRLDGCAYYGHDLGIEQFHNPSAKKLVRSLARIAQKRGLFALAQLDIDPAGASYFPTKQGWSVPAVDYAYSAVLAISLLSESAAVMKKHVRRTLRVPCNYIRPPRTHDGILLLSDNLTLRERKSLVRLCRHWKLPVRTVDGESYEVNSSLPFVCSLGVSKRGAWDRILLVIVLTAFLPGIPYFYLPFILNDVPEASNLKLDNDPRSLNRARVLAGHIKHFWRSKKSRQLNSLLVAMDAIREAHPDSEFKISSFSSNRPKSVLVVTRDADRCVFACNFSATKTAAIQLPKATVLKCGNYASGGGTLGPLGFGVWVLGSSKKEQC